MAKVKFSFKVRWLLALYDLILLLIVAALVFFLNSTPMNFLPALYQILLALGCLTISRFAWLVYAQVWRYGGVVSYLRVIIADACAYVAYYPIQRFLLPEAITYTKCLAFLAVFCLGSLLTRMTYRFIYKYCRNNTKWSRVLITLVNFFGHTDLRVDEKEEATKIRVAIVGAGRVGTGLAEELINNPNAFYEPVLFIDQDTSKVGRAIHGIKVVHTDEASPEMLKDMKVQEIVFAMQQWDNELKKNTYHKYNSAGFKIKTYDFPSMGNAEQGSKRHLREFDIAELLFRPQMKVINEETYNFYKDKVVLITGGGGSIGSELCRQIAKMSPKKIVILDIYENCAYDVQQELKMKYGANLDLQVEIVSICNRPALDRVFASHRPNIVVMAAAHKHVPLMEHNIIEAVENNVFGTLNTVELAEKYNVDRVHMVSTDKAVNPTSVMGATKRICEMIVQSHSTKDQHTTFSATRFGNVLGSAGSVIPLFKRQIANGGPITLTDYRIIRYFMTIPEASQLVLASSSMAKNGELFVLDMGQPVKIYDLAVNMIRLSGFELDKDIKIIETGLRPGEKLYEELLVKTEELDKTDNELIFIERDKPLSFEEVEEKLNKLRAAIESGDDKHTKDVIKEVVPTFKEKEAANEGWDGKEVK